MKLLSRVAERLYWLARYLERTENTARLIKSYNNLIMDIPIGTEPSWMILVDILDEVIATIRASEDRKDARANLIAKFSFSEIQADAILDLRLHRLTGLQLLQLREEVGNLAEGVGVGAAHEAVAHHSDIEWFLFAHLLNCDFSFGRGRRGRRSWP